MGVYEELVDTLMPQVMGFMFGFEQTLEEERRLEGLRTVIGVTRNWLYRSCLGLWEALLMKGDTRDSMAKREQEQRDREEAKKAYEELQGGGGSKANKRRMTVELKCCSGE